MFRANCSEYFPIFITVLWTSGVFFSQGDQTQIADWVSVTVLSFYHSVNVCLFQVCLQSVGCSIYTDASNTFVDIHSRHRDGRKQQQLSICLFGLNIFKQINGSEVLTRAQVRLQNSPRIQNFSHFMSGIL